MMGFFDFEFKMDDIKKHQPPLQKLNKVGNRLGDLSSHIRIRIIEQKQSERCSPTIWL